LNEANKSENYDINTLNGSRTLGARYVIHRDKHTELKAVTLKVLCDQLFKATGRKH